MKEIKLNKGMVALVDDCDYELVNQWKWYVKQGTSALYAVRVNDDLRMHRLILGVTDPKVRCDHKDHNGLNNQRSNIRIVTNSGNGANRTVKPGKKYLGVSWSKCANKWEARLKKNYKSIYLGLFINERDAAIAYNEAATIYHGEFANLNAV